MRTQLLAVVLVFACALLGEASGQSVNNRPVIGILTLPCTDSSFCDSQRTSYFPASYVKWVEAGGAQVVPVHYQSSETELVSLLDQLNGMLFTGGGASLADGSEYFAAVQVVYNYTVARHAQGDYFPLWGTCLGFESLMRAQSLDPDILTAFDAENVTLTLQYTAAAKTARVFDAGRIGAMDAMAIMGKENVTMNNHHWGVSPEDFAQNERLSGFFSVLATSLDRRGKQFVSMVEATSDKHPIYGVQFHPEKNVYEWWPNEVMQHTADAIQCAQNLAQFFVDETRKNHHRFLTQDALDAVIIYNDTPVFTNTFFEQCYFWNN